MADGGVWAAPFFVSREWIDRIQSDRVGEFSVERSDPDYHYQLLKNARKFEGTSRAFGAVAQLQASLSYLEKLALRGSRSTLWDSRSGFMKDWRGRTSAVYTRGNGSSM